MPNARFAAPKRDSEVNQVIRSVVRERIGAGYFATLDVPVVRGREFSERDQRVSASGGAALAAIINQTAAHEFFGEDDPIGRRITADQSFIVDANGLMGNRPMGTLSEHQNYTVVGIVRDIKGGGGKLQDDKLFKDATGAVGMPDQTNGWIYVNFKDGVPLVEGFAQLSGTEIPRSIDENLRPLRTLVAYASRNGATETVKLFVQTS